jgi:ABC-type Fe3+-hydroxamate transport system substrate-binding protein
MSATSLKSPAPSVASDHSDVTPINMRVSAAARMADEKARIEQKLAFAKQRIAELDEKLKNFPRLTSD